MSCRFIVRTSDIIRQWELDEWTAFVALATLSLEPCSIDELFEGMRRYQPDHVLSEGGGTEIQLDEIAGDSGWCFVDLVGKTVIGGGDFELPETSGAYEPLEHEEADGFPIVWFAISDDWLFRTAVDGWEALVNHRAAAAREKGRVDARSIMFGRPLLKFLSDAVISAAAENPEFTEDQAVEMTRSIHAKWLMTTRDDLQGRTPREFLLKDRERIQRDLEHRSQQWTRQGFAAPGLDPDSAAYRYGGFGIIEVIVYFDLIRELLGTAWELVRNGLNQSEHLVELLRTHRDTWLHQPFEEDGIRTPRAELIDLERRRIPIVSDPSQMHCDCPICRAEAEGAFGSGPAFMLFDGHHLELEDDFAFSLTEDFEEWQCQQESYKSMRAEFERELAMSGSGRISGLNAEGIERSVWRSSFVDWGRFADGEGTASQYFFAIAFPLAELIEDLKGLEGGRQHVNAINTAYDQVRRSTDRVTASSAVEQVIWKLEEVCKLFPELTPKCADLQSHLDEALRRME